MYESIEDPYCYSGTSVLINIPGLRDDGELAAFETIATAQRAEEPLPQGALDVVHYQSIHHHLFQDVYPWAGTFRTVRIGKGGSGFCYPEHIAGQMEILFANLQAEKFFEHTTPDTFAARASAFIATLNAIHPFREGNGRTQTVFLYVLAQHAGHNLVLDDLDEKAFLASMIESFSGETSNLAAQLRLLIK